ncbi:PREDICTED: F-box only protein 34 [Nanorana parkeri]|uniref:F-box only protein 34 n=1 Tax=Nanorana parkeri TaxID=125878 RepID=UPI000854D096|nr:PREDICTED: F-box only protein 34 [Nanorana parkeri]
MTSCRAGFHRDQLKLYLPSQHVKRASGMPLKPYHKLQKKEGTVLDLRSNKGMHLNNQSSAKEEQCNGATKKCLPSSDNQPRKPLGTISQNTMCNNAAMSASNGFEARSKKVPNATIHQDDDDDEGCHSDSCTLIKPGNTKEKIAFFALHHYRSNSMKIKSTGDGSGRAAKRRKKSVDLKRLKNHPEKVHEVQKMCLFSESFSSGVENCSINYVTDNDGILPTRPLSVIEMVAFLEDRASALLSDCAKPFSNSPPSKCVGPSKCGHPSVSLMALEASEAPSDKEQSENSEQESVCVLEMVAKLESECLRRQNERESGGLSRSNSLRRHVGRMLLASGLQQDANHPTKPSTDLDRDKELAASAMENNILQNKEDLRSVKSWETHPTTKHQDLESRPPVEDCFVASVGLELVKETYLKLGCKGDIAVTVDPCKFSISVCIKAVECVPDSFESPTLDDRAADKVETSPDSASVKAASVLMTTSSRHEVGHAEDKALTGDTPPGKIFFQNDQNCSKRALGQFSPDVKIGAENLETKTFDNTLCLQNSSMIAQYSLSISSLGNVTQVLDSCSIKRQASHDFLETRFKIQQLLEPQQYMAFLPHHILVKIFRYLPTRTLAALKCTFCYFKFIIEHYDIRPCDSLWVRDPRYKDDPCKQCKKKYAKGDVSLCLWHPKPYCQALPYGPGFWMCCHMSQKDSRGCKVGLHDNRWVPAFHSLNRTVCKKSESELEED